MLWSVPWRRVFHAILVPVLTYASQVWFTDICQTSLLTVLQTAQNDACRKLAGIFRTTPVLLTQLLISIPPIQYRLRHLLRAAGARLAHLPSSCYLRNPDLSCKSTGVPRSFPTFPILPTITETPSIPPFDLFPPHPALPLWSHPQFTIHPKNRNHRLHKTNTVTLITTPSPSLKIFITTAPFHIPHSFFAAFAIFHRNSLLISDFTLSPTPTHALFLALISALRRAPPSLPILLFSTSLSFLTRCTDQSSLRYLPLSHSLLNVLTDLLLLPDIFVSGQGFSQAWTWTDKQDWIHPLREQATYLTLSWAPSPPSKDRIFTEWAEECPRLKRHNPRRLYPTFHNDPSPLLPPFTQGVLLAQSRPLQSACLQLITGHAFHS